MTSPDRSEATLGRGSKPSVAVQWQARHEASFDSRDRRLIHPRELAKLALGRVVRETHVADLAAHRVEAGLDFGRERLLITAHRSRKAPGDARMRIRAMTRATSWLTSPLPGAHPARNRMRQREYAAMAIDLG
ncbi:MAG TPA: hypothetical protein VFY18_06665 [Candidatus Limnocylindrales bacterium]|nr:hypothetical protein [Candidatus Limnocylindrales bacterium]